MGVWKGCAGAALALFCLAFAGAAGAYAKPAVTRVTVEPAPSGLRVEIEASRELKPKTFFIEGVKPRFVVDLPAVTWPTGQAAGAGPATGLAFGYRFASRDEQNSRLVVDLKVEGRLVEISRVREGGVWRFSYVLAPIPGARPPVSQPRVIEARAPAIPVEYLDARKVVVIDAGHGGKDSGALGVSGKREKDIALASALTLKAQLERTGRYKVALTRDSDEFIELEDRVKIARAAKADLFISLHADSNHNKAAKGASIYTLSSKGEARAKTMVASSQDWAIDMGESPRSDRAESILVDLTQRESKGRSAEFAELLAAHLAPVSPLIANTRRSENFFVLLAPDVPAVLLEMGFMTHADDEARLASSQARTAMMEAVARAIDAHFRPVMRQEYAEAGAPRASVSERGRP